MLKNSHIAVQIQYCNSAVFFSEMRLQASGSPTQPTVVTVT